MIPQGATGRRRQSLNRSLIDLVGGGAALPGRGALINPRWEAAA